MYTIYATLRDADGHGFVWVFYQVNDIHKNHPLFSIGHEATQFPSSEKAHSYCIALRLKHAGITLEVRHVR